MNNFNFDKLQRLLNISQSEITDKQLRDREVFINSLINNKHWGQSKGFQLFSDHLLNEINEFIKSFIEALNKCIETADKIEDDIIVRINNIYNNFVHHKIQSRSIVLNDRIAAAQLPKNVSKQLLIQFQNQAHRIQKIGIDKIALAITDYKEKKVNFEGEPKKIKTNNKLQFWSKIIIPLLGVIVLIIIYWGNIKNTFFSTYSITIPADTYRSGLVNKESSDIIIPDTTITCFVGDDHNNNFIKYILSFNLGAYIESGNHIKEAKLEIPFRIVGNPIPLGNFHIAHTLIGRYRTNYFENIHEYLYNEYGILEREFNIKWADINHLVELSNSNKPLSISKFNFNKKIESCLNRSNIKFVLYFDGDILPNDSADGIIITERPNLYLKYKSID